MTLDDKRKVIEVLLCAAGDANNVALFNAADGPGELYLLASDVVYESYQSRYPAGRGVAFSDRMQDAAYRLIESSPTLRREWFGAR